MAYHLTGPRPSTLTTANIEGVTTPPTSPNTSASTSEQLANEFNHSPISWDAHFPSGTSATTTTTTTATTVITTTSNATTSSSDPFLRSLALMPEWQKNLPEGFLRGDECFRERYGSDGSLLDDEGYVVEGFSLDEARCHPLLKRDAQSLAAIMDTRNGVAKDVLDARAALAKAEAALQNEKTWFELTQASAQRNAQPVSEAAFKSHEVALVALTTRRDDAMTLLASEERDLATIQESLTVFHTTAETRTKLSDDALNQELEGVERDERHGMLFSGLMWGMVGGTGFAIFRQLYFNISMNLARTGFGATPEMQAYALEREALANDLTRVTRDAVYAFLVVGALVLALKRLHRL